MDANQTKSILHCIILYLKLNMNKTYWEQIIKIIRIFIVFLMYNKS